MLSYMKSMFRTEIPQEIKDDLRRATYLIIGHGVPIYQIRLFGGLYKGKWDPSKSDIDIAIFLATNDERYSCYTVGVVGSHLHEDGETTPVLGQTKEREDLALCVEGNEGLVFGEKYETHIVTPNDLERLWREGEPAMGSRPDLSKGETRSFIRAMKKGLLLYPV